MANGNVELIAALYRAFAERDAATILRLIDPRVTVVQTRMLPWGGEYAGHEGLREFFDRLLAHVDSRVEPEEYLEAGERVVALGRTVGRARASGREFSVRVAHVWELDGGRVTRFEPYVDTPAMLAAVGEGEP